MVYNQWKPCENGWWLGVPLFEETSIYQAISSYAQALSPSTLVLILLSDGFDSRADFSMDHLADFSHGNPLRKGDMLQRDNVTIAGKGLGDRILTRSYSIYEMDRNG